ncbi:hypothetical protein OK016_27740 [Vibrio chagasii]|nr:hypothetical protein [Vibrio chagasii]
MKTFNEKEWKKSVTLIMENSLSCPSQQVPTWISVNRQKAEYRQDLNNSKTNSPVFDHR